LDREYLEDYEEKERLEYERVLRRMNEGKFSFERDKFPPDERFTKIQEPVATCPSLETSHINALYAQIPFCGSLILPIPPLPKRMYEENLGSVSEIPKLVDFAKETGKLQFALNSPPSLYVGLDFLDPIFKELQPPLLCGIPEEFLVTEREFKKTYETFKTLGKLGFFKWLTGHLDVSPVGLDATIDAILKMELVYLFLKLGKYSVVEEIENLIVDDYVGAFCLLIVCRKFITDPIRDLRHDVRNYSLEDIRSSKMLPLVYQPSKVSFPCEIGKLLLEKLTYAPLGLDACKELMYHYDKYDLRKVQESLNNAIITNHPDMVSESAEELATILDNVWKDKTIPRRVTGLRVGMPLSMAAIGSVVAGPVGAAGGFLAGLGYNVIDKSVDLGIEGLSERLAKLKTKNYQANIYDFRKKYKK
jgi:hypothetical protein